MNFAWQSHTSTRFDRYIDFELHRKTPKRDDSGWCAVSLTVRDDKPRENLARLLADVDSNSFLRMTADEHARLQTAARSRHFNPSQLDYFVYMRERDMYDNGEFKYAEHYTISFAGPPIPSLIFNEPKGRIEADRVDALRVSRIAVPRVAIGVIDDGIAFVHDRFRTPDAKQTRLSAVWLQDAEQVERDRDASGSSTIAFGSVLKRDDINALLESCGFDEHAVYRETGQLDFRSATRRPLGFRTSHGTQVMDLAAGHERVRDDPTTALFAVQVPTALIADSYGSVVGSYVLQAFRQIMLWADQIDETLPLVINFSFGNFAGPKDGYGLIEREIGRLVAHRNRRGGPTIAVLPAGNSYNQRVTAQMELTANGDASSSNFIDWKLLPDDHTSNFMEIWLPRGLSHRDASPFELTISTPSGESLPVEMPEAGEAKLLVHSGHVLGALYFDKVARDDGNSRPRYFLALGPTATFEAGTVSTPAGAWRVSLLNRCDVSVETKLTIQRDDTPYGHQPRGRQSFFDAPNAYSRDPETGSFTALDEAQGPITHKGSLSAIGNGENALLIGAANEIDGLSPSRYTSSGPTDVRVGPDLSVVVDEGQAVRGRIAAGTFSGSTAIISGTSAAAPQVTRVVADLIDRGIIRDFDKKSLLRALRKSGYRVGKDRERLGKTVLDAVVTDFDNLPDRRY